MEFGDHGPNYDLPENSNSTLPVEMQLTPGAGASAGELEVTGRMATIIPRFRECQRNYVASLGGHAVDGCCEFLPSGEDGTVDALKCAACYCHRNFHRKEANNNNPPPLPPLTAAATATNQHHYHVAPYHQIHLAFPLAAAPATAFGGYREEVEHIDPNNNPEGASGLKKRARTRFTTEQKEKMKEMAERVGWRLKKEDKVVVEQFCDDCGVKKQVFKVWMHNNKPAPYANKKP